MDSQQQKPTRRRKRNRWGDASQAPGDAPSSASTTTSAGAVSDPKAKLKAMQESIQARLAAAKAAASTKANPIPTASSSSSSSSLPPAARVSALQQSIQARLAAAKAKQQLEQQPITSTSNPRPTKRAKQYELDLNVTAPSFSSKTSSTATTSTTKSQPKVKLEPVPPPPPSNPYLAHTVPSSSTISNNDAQQTDDNDLSVDPRLQASKSAARSKRELSFVQPGKWQEIAERQRAKAAQLEASGFLSGRKAGHSIQATTLGESTTAASASDNAYGPSAGDDDDSWSHPRWDAHPDTQMPLVMEWWDMELLPFKLKKQVGQAESQALTQSSKEALTQNLQQDTDASSDSKPAAKSQDANDSTAVQKLRETCWENAALFHCKTADLVQHIVPIQNTMKQDAPKPVLHLTKKELKRQRKLRREKKQRELQDLQAAGLIPAPEPRLTLQNFIKVLGDQAFLDPSKYEQKVVAQIQARQAAHVQRNEAAKLTKEQRAAKVDGKLQKRVDEAISKGEVHVALFFVQNTSHPYHRTKMDLNARQWKITGGVLECAAASIACVIAEGAPQSIQKYIRLMTVRMNWTSGPDGAVLEKNGEDVEQYPFDPSNSCELVWQGMATKRHFAHFSFQSGETPEQCRKILKQKSLAHYWDQVVQIGKQKSKSGSSVLFKLTKDDDNEDEPSSLDNDVEMSQA